jgi:hypothetical protein
MSDEPSRRRPWRVRVGRALGRSFDLLAHGFTRFYAIAAVVSAPLLLYDLYGNTYIARYLRDPVTFGLGAFFGTALAFYALLVLLQSLGQAVIAHRVLQQLRGRPFGVGESLARGFARFLPILGILLLIGLALLGVLLLVMVPLSGIAALSARGSLGVSLVISAVFTLVVVILGPLLLVCWFVAMPQRLGPVGSLGRSSFLTRGFRWKIFGIYLLLLVTNAIVGIVLRTILLRTLGWYPTAVGVYLWQSLATAFGAIVVAVAYFYLRTTREGIDVERLAAVFE